MDLEAELDALYAQPLESFVAARNELAARLRIASDREAAARVKALARPGPAAWCGEHL